MRLIICGKLGSKDEHYGLREKVFTSSFARTNAGRFPQGTITTTAAIPENMFPDIKDTSAMQGLLNEVLASLGIRQSGIKWTVERYVDNGEWLVYKVEGV